MIHMFQIPGQGVFHVWPNGEYYVVNDGGRFDPKRKPVPGSMYRGPWVADGSPPWLAKDKRPKNPMKRKKR